MSESIVKFAYAILLAASKKSAEAFRIRPDGDNYVVEFLLGGKTAEETRGPTEVLAAVIRRIGVMASLPPHKKGEVATGVLQLQSTSANHYFAIEVSGHGPALALQGRVLTEADYHRR